MSGPRTTATTSSIPTSPEYEPYGARNNFFISRLDADHERLMRAKSTSTPAPVITGLPPIVNGDARVLILGSMPSVQSLKHGQYYAHPRNRFWELIGRVLGVRELHARAYSDRVQTLRENHIALWDVAQKCRRVGSADATMAQVEANDIAGLLRTSPGIGAIFCNGRKSETLFKKLVEPGLVAPVQVDYLPSTSPANAAWTMPRLLTRWRAIGTRF